MATVSTYSTVLRVELQDQELNIYALSLNNPRNNLSRAEVLAAFDYVLGGNSSESKRPVIYSKAESPYTQVGTVQTVETTITKRDLT